MTNVSILIGYMFTGNFEGKQVYTHARGVKPAMRMLEQ